MIVSPNCHYGSEGRQNLDLEITVIVGRDFHTFDQVAQAGFHLVARRGVSVERQRQATHARSIGVDDPRIECDHWHRLGFLSIAAEALSVRFSCGQRLSDIGEVGCAVLDRADQSLHLRVSLCDSPIEIRDVARPVGALCLDLVVIVADQRRDGIGGKQMLGDALHHPRLDNLARDGPHDIAGARLASAGASHASAADHRISAAASAADDEAGEQVLRALAEDEGSAGPIGGLILDELPEIVGDDSQLGHFDQHPLRRRIDPRHAPPGLRVAPHRQPIIGILSGIDRIVEHPQAARARSGDRRGAPLATARGRDAIGIQPLGDRLWPASGRIFTIDSQHHGRLLGIDLPQAAIQLAVGADRRYYVVAIGKSARDTATRYRPPLSPPDLVGKILDEERGHRALQSDVQLADVAFGQGVDADIGEFEPLIDRRDVRLIPSDAIDRFGADDLERASAGVGEHLCHAGSPVGRARNGDVGVDADDFPSFALGARGADRDLVLGGLGGLKVG